MSNYSGINIIKIISQVIKVKINSNHAISMYPKDNVLGMVLCICSPLQNSHPSIITKHIRQTPTGDIPQNAWQVFLKTAMYILRKNTMKMDFIFKAKIVYYEIINIKTWWNSLMHLQIYLWKKREGKKQVYIFIKWKRIHQFVH